MNLVLNIITDVRLKNHEYALPTKSDINKITLNFETNVNSKKTHTHNQKHKALIKMYQIIALVRFHIAESVIIL